MAHLTREEAIAVLQDGNIQMWNHRRADPSWKPDLSRGRLTRASLPEIDLCEANLHDVRFHEADLRRANLERANASGAQLSGANLRGANLRGANLREADLFTADLTEADLSGADLYNANLTGAVLFRTNLREASLPQANLREATLRDTDLRGANLREANFWRTNFHITARVHGADVTGARFGQAAIACNLHQVKGLDETKHSRASSLAIDTVLSFRDKLPEQFLRGCGVREEEIAYFRSAAATPARFYSCFISYSVADEAFASRLYDDFQDAGIRCWKWDHDARTGRSIWGEIDQAIRVYDKLIVVASESSLESPSVNREIERAIYQEDRRQRDGKEADILFPVRLDDYIFDRWDHERKPDVVRKVIADARQWEDAHVYAAIRDRLITDLKQPAPPAAPQG